MFNPEKLVQRLYSKDFNLLNAIRGRGTRHMTLHEDQEASIFKDLKTLALIIFIFICVVFVMFMFVAFSEKYKDRVKR